MSVQLNDMLRYQFVSRRVGSVEQDEDEVEARQQRPGHLQVLAHRLAAAAYKLHESEEQKHTERGLGTCSVRRLGLQLQ